MITFEPVGLFEGKPNESEDDNENEVSRCLLA